MDWMMPGTDVYLSVKLDCNFAAMIFLPHQGAPTCQWPSCVTAGLCSSGAWSRKSSSGRRLRRYTSR